MCSFSEEKSQVKEGPKAGSNRQRGPRPLPEATFPSTLWREGPALIRGYLFLVQSRRGASCGDSCDRTQVARWPCPFLPTSVGRARS